MHAHIRVESLTAHTLTLVVSHSMGVASVRGGTLRDVTVSIHGDNSFYSMPQGDHPRFAPMTKPSDSADEHAAEVHKTGEIKKQFASSPRPHKHTLVNHSPPDQPPPNH